MRPPSGSNGGNRDRTVARCRARRKAVARRISRPGPFKRTNLQHDNRGVKRSGKKEDRMRKQSVAMAAAVLGLAAAAWGRGPGRGGFAARDAEGHAGLPFGGPVQEL